MAEHGSRVKLKCGHRIFLKRGPHIIRQTEYEPHILEPLECGSRVRRKPRVVEECRTHVLEHKSMSPILELVERESRVWGRQNEGLILDANFTLPERDASMNLAF